MKGFCVKCGISLEGVECGGIGNATFCKQHYEEASAVRSTRMKNALSRRDVLMERYKEMREAIELRDRYRREAEDVKANLRCEVVNAVWEEVRRLSFWRRLSLLFNPFGGRIT